MRSFTATEPLFIDTWGWLVLANDRDPAYARVVELRRQYAARRAGWVTTDYVLDEAITRLFAAAPFARAEKFCDAIFEARRSSLLSVERITAERFESAWKLRVRYKNKPRISFTDLTSIAVMRELGLRQILTGDTHFDQVRRGFQKVP